MTNADRVTPRGASWHRRDHHADGANQAQADSGRGVPDGLCRDRSGAYDDEFVDKAGGRTEKHRVRITQPFYLGVYEVTQAQYEAVMGVNPSYFASSGGGKDKVAGRVDGYATQWSKFRGWMR